MNGGALDVDGRNTGGGNYNDPLLRVLLEILKKCRFSSPCFAGYEDVLYRFPLSQTRERIPESFGNQLEYLAHKQLRVFSF